MKKEKISFTIGLFIAFMITTGLSSCQKSLEVFIHMHLKIVSI